jgi:hypothetical protein
MIQPPFTITIHDLRRLYLTPDVGGVLNSRVKEDPNFRKDGNEWL